MVFDSVIIVDSTKSIISLGVSYNVSPICLIMSSDPLKLESSSFVFRAPFHSRLVLLWSPAIFFPLPSSSVSIHLQYILHSHMLSTLH